MARKKKKTPANKQNRARKIPAKERIGQESLKKAICF